VSDAPLEGQIRVVTEVPERRPAIGATFVHKLTKQTLIVLDHEGEVNASVWFTVRDANMLTHRCRVEEVDTVPAQSEVKQGGQYL